jgi:hypothetical protein
MTDTHPEAVRYLEERYAALTPFERVEMACSMYDFAKEIVTQSILNADPKASPGEVRRQTFRRFYSSDFSEDRIQELLEYIDRFL